MSQLNSPLTIYKYLQKSNCRQCKVPSCLAFATAVVTGQKHLADCPHLDQDIIERFSGKINQHITYEQQQEQTLEQLKKGVAAVDFASAAGKLGAVLTGGNLVIQCLGREFMVEANGDITSDCHLNTWLTIPLINYVVLSKGKNVSGQWVPFRELKNGATWNPLFSHRCEKTLKQIADSNAELLEDIIYTFGGRPAAGSCSADISLVLHPLPKVPLLICYWKPEDDLESKLSVFFDTTAEENLNIESIYMLGVGLVLMFQKIAYRHSQ